MPKKNKLNGKDIMDVTLIEEKRLELINQGIELCKEYLKNIDDNDNQ